MKTQAALAAAAAAASLALAAAPAAADANLDFAKSKGCTACHDVNKKLVGPPYADVAKKYKADKEAPAKLVGSVTKGSMGKWGPIPMPPNKVSDDEAKKLVAWVLTL